MMRREEGGGGGGRRRRRFYANQQCSAKGVIRNDYSRSNQSIKSNHSQHHQISDHPDPLGESSAKTP